MSEWMTPIIAAVVGIIASLSAPWATWGTERSRIRMDRRKEKVDSWYKIVEDAHNKGIDPVKHKNYVTLRSHLKPDIVKKLEKANVIHVNRGTKGLSSNIPAETLLKEIARIENEWKLS